MSELTNLLMLIGLFELPNDIPSPAGADNEANYLLEGERILSLAREKKKRPLFKTENLTVRLCDLGFPRLDPSAAKATNQIQSAIHRKIKNILKECNSREHLSIKGVPFFLQYCGMEGISLEICQPENLETSLARDVSKSDYILALTVGKEKFYLPCRPRRKFKNCDYFYKENKKRIIHMLHIEDAFYTLACLYWVNGIIMESVKDHALNTALKEDAKEYIPSFTNFSWAANGLSEWFVSYLADEGYYFSEKQNLYIHPDRKDADAADENQLEEIFCRECCAIFRALYGKEWIGAEIVLNGPPEMRTLHLPWHLESLALKTLAYYISSIQNLQEEERHRKTLDGMVARAYMTKRNIPQHVLHKMRTSSLNDYFGFIEFDEDVDMDLADVVTDEFIRCNKQIFHGLKCPDTALRFRKLGRHHASGLYYPSINTIVVDYRHPDSFIHEYFHMLDDMMGDLSRQGAFYEIATAYSVLLRKKVEALKKEKKPYPSSKGKYSLNYYLMRSEIFARCGEMHLFRNMHVVSSLLKPEETSYFAYPNDPELNRLIDTYYTGLLSGLSNHGNGKEETDETDLCVASH